MNHKPINKRRLIKQIAAGTAVATGVAAIFVARSRMKARRAHGKTTAK